MFVQVIRPHVTAESDYVFLTWNEQPMTSSQINKALQSVFKKATVSTMITSASFRKAAVTNVHERNPEMSGNLVNLMAHNEATAGKYYLLYEKTKASVEASQHLSSSCEQSLLSQKQKVQRVNPATTIGTQGL